MDGARPYASIPAPHRNIHCPSNPQRWPSPLRVKGGARHLGELPQTPDSNSDDLNNEDHLRPNNGDRPNSNHNSLHNHHHDSELPLGWRPFPTTPTRHQPVPTLPRRLFDPRISAGYAAFRNLAFLPLPNFTPDILQARDPLPTPPVVLHPVDIATNQPSDILAQLVAEIGIPMEPVDLLAQALAQAGISTQEDPPEPPTPPPSSTTRSASTYEEELRAAAVRILTFLQAHPQDNLPDPQGEQEEENPDSLESLNCQPARPHPGPWKPPHPPQPHDTHWDRFATLFNEPRTRTFQALKIRPTIRYSHRYYPPPPAQQQALQIAISQLLHANIIEKTKRGPFLSPVFLVRKPDSSSRLIVDFKHLTQKLAKPSMRLPPPTTVF